VGNALSFTHELSFFIFYQSIVLSSHAEDGHQMYLGDSVVGKDSTCVIGISPTHPLIFTGVKKYEIWGCLKHYSTLSNPHLKMQQNIRS